MKKLMFILTAILVLGFATISHAQTSANVSATATVDTELRLTASVVRVDSKNTETYSDDSWCTTSVPMTFGRLSHTLANGNEAGTLFSKPYYYVAFLGGFTSGRKYTITSTCIGLIGPKTITEGFGVTFIDGNPVQADKVTPINATPLAQTTGSLGLVGLASVSNKVLYDSGVGGASRVITAYYGIPPYKTDGSIPYTGFVKIPTDTPAGDYTGNVTFNLTLY